MKITVEPYSASWPGQFQEIKAELSVLLQPIDPVIEHIGSTSVPGLAAKPVIDVQIGIDDAAAFSFVEERLARYPYIYYQVYNTTMPNRRLFVRLKDHIPPGHFPNIYSVYENIPHADMNQARIANIHVWQKEDPDFLRHLAFRDYLIAHPDVLQQYARLKILLSEKEWKDMNEYNDGKNDFIQREQSCAIAWYKNRYPLAVGQKLL